MPPDRAIQLATNSPVNHVGSETGEAEQGEGLVASTFGRKEVAVMRAAMRVHQLDPPAAEALEGVDLRRIDHVLNDASDHTSA